MNACQFVTFSLSSISIETKTYNANLKSENKLIQSDFNEKFVCAKDIFTAIYALLCKSFFSSKKKKEQRTHRWHFNGNLYHVTSKKVLLSKNITT